MGGLEHGILISGEVWPSRATMEALCHDTGVSRENFDALFSKVISTVSQWPRFANQAKVPLVKAREIRERLQHIGSRIILPQTP
jgi:hypothetical protein